jgi:hypothetical protein
MSSDDRPLDPDPSRPRGLSDGQFSPLIPDVGVPHPIQPPVEFWENRLEVPAGRILEDARVPGFLAAWLKHRSARQVAVLSHLLGIPTDVSAR